MWQPCGFVPQVMTSMQYNVLVLRPRFMIISSLLIFYIVPEMSSQLSSRLVVLLAIQMLSSRSALRFYPSLVIRGQTISFVVLRQWPNVPSHLRTHLLLRLPFRSLSELTTLMLLYLTILTPIKVLAVKVYLLNIKIPTYFPPKATTLVC